MDPEETLDRLIEAGVLAPDETGRNLAVSDPFQARLADLETTFREADAAEVEAILADAAGDPDVLAALRGRLESDPDFLVRYVALAEQVRGLDHLDTLRVAVVLDQFDGDPPRDESAPDRFLPIRGESLETVTALFERCLVYIWRENCERCDVVREDLEAVFAEGVPEDVLLLSVYGPDCARYLQEEYDVVGGPTTLFVLDGSVDARLIGAPDPEVLARELETLRDRAVQPT